MRNVFGTEWSRAVVLACLLGGVSLSTADELAPGDRLSPSSKLTPEQVVHIQLEALRRNDARNRGIELAFRFASPDNKLHTGPLPRFISMMQEGPYSLMLDYENVAYEPVEVADGRARQRVTLIGSGLVVVYEFYLSRQSEGPCTGCWLTDAVIAKRPSGLQVRS